MITHGKLLRRKPWLAVLGLAVVLNASAWAAPTIAEKGKSRYRLVIAADAIPSERYAAEELQRYLEKISGASLPIVSDAGPMESREILLGDNAHLRRLKVNIDFSRLGAEGFVLRSEASRFIIAARNPRGT